ncbi:hypothetical protein [Sulfurirhabdus autotrophica]|nr:hypothetical protein [Sulfurirhabdus autotrophica]
MKKLNYLLKLVGSIQIFLGLAYLFAPALFLHAMGHSMPQPDIYYPLGMLAARFISYGIALFIISSAPAQHVLWINFMILIQVIDLGVGIFYTSIGVIPLSLSAFPMFNATWIILLLTMWHPMKEPANGIAH